MDLIETNNFFIIVNGSQALYCDRLVGKLTIRHASDVFNEWNPVCLGKIDGVIGKIRYHSDSDWRLFLISSSKSVGILPDGLEVRRISRVTVLVLNTTPLGNLNLNSCTRSHPEIPKKNIKPTTQNLPQRPFMKLMQKHVIPPDARNPRWRILKRKEKYEQRIEEELINMLQSEDESYFYFSPGGGDLTNWTQRKTHPSYWNGVPVNTDDLLTDNTTSEEQSYYFSKQFKPVWYQPVWRRADERFFWNFHLISQPIIEADRMLTTCGFPAYGSNFKSSDSPTQFNSLVTDLEGLLMPIVQGYVHFEEFVLDRLQGHLQVNVVKKTKEFIEKSNSDSPLIGVEFLNNSVNTNSNEEDQINIIGLNNRCTVDVRGGRTAHYLQPSSYNNDNVGISVKQAVEFDPSVFSSTLPFSSSSSSTTTGTGKKQSPSIIKLSQSNSLMNISNDKEKSIEITTPSSGSNSIIENTVETVCLNTSNMASSNDNLLSKDNPYDSNNMNNNSSHNHLKPMIIRDMEHVTVIIFSRRSCYRAGTRYRRRGIDKNGHVANYVETEQILHTNISEFPHTVVFLQCRGSVPLYWSQTSLVYNPPILLEKWHSRRTYTW
ncbi:putative suppressor of actin (sac) [Schistosoma mansoni]|uniref:putative suppressor of actin (sac) n=1 Tax=Schistosoma mansoni TaxID=6183 RepID=UPI0001A64493|nr:putative suppressor of actin (sac) [Schistosoma mansoni]|eukprot:XP_018651382.1 putative suppressor of actin (sac) [Schistosoma mansoni]